MTYHEANQLLEQAGRRKKLYPIYLRLKRLDLLFKTLGIDPASPSVHIAGTSGKGSTSSLVAGILQASGYKVGLHTTPHLQTPRERMIVGGQLPSEQGFAQLVHEVYQAAMEVEQLYSYGAFNSQELLFTVAAYYFKKMRVNIAVIETFMGGQYDSTNVIKPLISVVTNVDLDHTKVLGNTIESIAMVKAGVIKPSTPFITGATQASVIEIFRRRCRDLGTPCIIIGEDNWYRSRLLGSHGSILSAQVLESIFANLHLKLLGQHQINNALVALYVTQVLRSLGWLIPDAAIRNAFATAFIPGRLEVVEQDPSIILDGAHNPAKVKALATSLKRIFKDKKVIFVFANKKGKDFKANVKPLLELAAKFILTTLPHNKGQAPERIAEVIREANVPVVTRLDPLQALALARSQVKKDQVICITGSLHLVGQLRNHWYPNQSIQEMTSDDNLWPTLAGEPVRQSEVSGGRR